MSCEESASACYSPQRLVDNSADNHLCCSHALLRYESRPPSRNE
jgi:hypothetical protein